MAHCTVLTMQGNLQGKKLFGSHDSFQPILMFALADKYLHTAVSYAHCVLPLVAVVAKYPDNKCMPKHSTRNVNALQTAYAW
jgi:hypothetical protein